MKDARVAGGVAFLLGVIFAAGLYYAPYLRHAERVAAIPKQENWFETKWPFPMDEWGQGKAYRCAAADCGTELNLYIRTKIGSCNCTTGVADDEDLDRLSDFDFMGPTLAALDGGHAINVGVMKGRIRAYTSPLSNKSALSIAFNHRCDAVVATVATNTNQMATVESTVIEFLNSTTVLQWAAGKLGLE